MSGFEFVASSPQTTSRAGRLLGELLQPGDCIALTGDLGAGKTHLTKSIAEGMGITGRVLSPSFNLLLEYPGRVRLRHLDAYFASREAALLDEACGEVFSKDGVAIVEWAERVESYLPATRLEIRVEILGEESRRIRVLALGPQAEQRQRAWHDRLAQENFEISKDRAPSP